MIVAEIGKLRRFALAIGIIFFTFAIAGIELQTPAEISPLGIPLVIKQPQLIGFGFFLASLYSLFRYWYYAIFTGTSPRKARKNLRSGFLADGSNYAEDASKFGNIAKKQIEEYLYISVPIEEILIKRGDVGSFFLPLTEGGGGDAPYKFSVNFESFPQKLFISKTPIEVGIDIDYYAPVWVNVIAMITWIAKLAI